MFLSEKKWLEYYRQLAAIKHYLINEGVIVDEVIMWQGGFRHEGTPHGLEVLATVIINGVEEVYCIPKHVVQSIESLKYLKIEKRGVQ
jgi:hypothetical protein